MYVHTSLEISITKLTLSINKTGSAVRLRSPSTPNPHCPALALAGPVECSQLNTSMQDHRCTIGFDSSPPDD